MKRRIKVAAFIRVALLIGPGICYYLFTNTFVNNENKGDSPTSDGIPSRFTSRSLLNVKDQDARDVLFSQHEAETTTNDLRNDSSMDDSVGSAKFVNNVTKGNGHIIIQIIASAYCFWMLGIICNEYFIESIKIICQKLSIEEDVAGATIMAMATSSPELIVSCVGTFVTEGDVGLATIVGSAVFNILAIPAICGLLTRTAIQLDWWPVTRDCLFYGLSVIILSAVLYDNQIMWYEAACMVGVYGIYLMFMYKDKAMSEKAKVLAKTVKRRIHQQPYQEVTEITPFFTQFNESKLDSNKINVEFSEPLAKFSAMSSENFARNPWALPYDTIKFLFLLRWPITLILWCTIPDAKRFKQLYILTFINCILWIGCISHFAVFLSSNVDTKMGMTILAIGTSSPEAISSLLVTAQGYGSMGISNSIGSNTFDILLCLGLPWLIKTLIAPTISGHPWITLKSTGISHSTISLLTTLFALYLTLILNKFHLNKKFGFICLLFYCSFLIFTFHGDLNVIFPFNTAVK